METKPIPLEELSPGDLVFVERDAFAVDLSGKPLSNYGSGELIVTEVGIGTIHGVSPGDGYQLNEIKHFPLIGQNAWVVIAKRSGREAIVSALKTLDEFAREDVEGKRRWVSYVYGRAARNRVRLQEILETLDAGPADDCCCCPGSYSVTLTAVDVLPSPKMRIAAALERSAAADERCAAASEEVARVYSEHLEAMKPQPKSPQ